jgi:hypothetical protein
MSIKEPHPLLAQAINIRSRSFRLRVEAPRIAKPHIISKDENDIRLFTAACVAGPERKPPRRQSGSANTNTPKKPTPRLF